MRVHPRALIGRDVWFFPAGQNWGDHHKPRAAKVVGLGQDGMVNLLVFSDPMLDCLNRSMAQVQQILDVRVVENEPDPTKPIGLHLCTLRA